MTTTPETGPEAATAPAPNDWEVAHEALADQIEAILDGNTTGDGMVVAEALRAAFDAAGRTFVEIVVTSGNVVVVTDPRPEPADGLVAEITFEFHQPVEADGEPAGEKRLGWHVTEPEGIDNRSIALLGEDMGHDMTPTIDGAVTTEPGE